MEIELLRTLAKDLRQAAERIDAGEQEWLLDGVSSYACLAFTRTAAYLWWESEKVIRRTFGNTSTAANAYRIAALLCAADELEDSIENGL